MADEAPWRRDLTTDLLEAQAAARYGSPTGRYVYDRLRRRTVAVPVHNPASAADLLAGALGGRREALAWLDAARVALGGGR